jgi:hypothetical protein
VKNVVVLHYLFARAKKMGFNLQVREMMDYDAKTPWTHRIKGMFVLLVATGTTYFDQFGLDGLIERSRFGLFLW